MSGLSHYTPAIQNPYPKSWREISAFRVETETSVARPARPDPTLNREYQSQYYTTSEFVVSCCVDGDLHEIRLPSGMLTDLATIPPPFNLFIGRKGRHLPAVLMHDYLSIAWQDITVEGAEYVPTDEDFRFSNAVLREGLLALGYPRFGVLIVERLASGRWARKRFDDINNHPRYVCWNNKPLELI